MRMFITWCDRALPERTRLDNVLGFTVHLVLLRSYNEKWNFLWQAESVNPCGIHLNMTSNPSNHKAAQLTTLDP